MGLLVLKFFFFIERYNWIDNEDKFSWNLKEKNIFFFWDISKT